MSRTFLFPGQGVNILPALEDWHRSSALVRALVDPVLDALYLSREALYRHGGRELQSTGALQPLLTALSLGILAELREAGAADPSWVVGHSLGEIAALSAAGAVGAPDAVEIARIRGHLMGEANKASPSGMLALVGCDQTLVDKAIDLGRCHGRIGLAAMNAPDEWVLSGDEAALIAVRGRFPSVRLPVSGGFHGPSLTNAARELEQELARFRFSRPRIGFVSSITGRPLDHGTDMARHLAGQLTAHILWTDCLKFLADSGVNEFVTVGPGKILRGLLRKNFGIGVSVDGTDTPDECQRTMEALAS